MYYLIMRRTLYQSYVNAVRKNNLIPEFLTQSLAFMCMSYTRFGSICSFEIRWYANAVYHSMKQTLAYNSKQLCSTVTRHYEYNFIILIGKYHSNTKSYIYSNVYKDNSYHYSISILYTGAVCIFLAIVYYLHRCRDFAFYWVLLAKNTEKKNRICKNKYNTFLVLYHNNAY